MVVTSLVELSGDHFGECATIVAKFTSEYGIPDGELNAGINRFPSSVYKVSGFSSLDPNFNFQIWTSFYVPVIRLTALVKNILSPVKWYALKSPPSTRMVTSNKLTSRFTSNFKYNSTQFLASSYSIEIK